jgi:hypothetical protein
LGLDLNLCAVLHSNLAVFHFLLFSLLFLGGEAPVIGNDISITCEIDSVVASMQP